MDVVTVFFVASMLWVAIKLFLDSGEKRDMKEKATEVEGKDNDLKDEAPWKELRAYMVGMEDRFDRKYQRRTKREAWLIYFSAVIIAIIAAVAVYFIRIEGTSVLMKHLGIFDLLIPALGLIVSVYFVYLGVTRLKDMDEQMNYMRDRIAGEVERVFDIRTEIKEETSKAIVAEKEKALEKVSEEFKKVSGEIENFKEQYSWLENSGMGEDAVSGWKTVDSIRKAIAALSNRKDLRLNDYAETVEKYVYKIITKIEKYDVISADKWDRYDIKADIMGTECDYHQLIVELNNQKLYELALEVSIAANKLHRNNDYLLADQLWCAIDIGVTARSKAAEAVCGLNNIPKAKWNWRAFDNVTKYYQIYGKLTKAEEMGREFRRYFPDNENAYYRLARVAMRQYPPNLNNRGSSPAVNLRRKDKEYGYYTQISILKDPLKRGISCPRCATRLAKIYIKRNDLDKALKAANRAVQELAVSKPREKSSYVIYLRALIRDRMAYKERESGVTGARQNADTLAEEAAVDYMVAIDSKKLEPAQDANAAERLNMLDVYFDLGVYKYKVKRTLEEREKRIEDYGTVSS